MVLKTQTLWWNWDRG